MNRQYALIALVSSLAAAVHLCAQGGPPMLTDDPGTPGANKWELNEGWTTLRTPGSTLTGLPELDLNYGIGDRIEVTYFVNYDDLSTSGENSRWGLSDSEFAVKWRFYDTGEGGAQMSVYPQVNIPTPWTHSDRRGFAESGISYELPVEYEKDFKIVSVNLDLGHSFETDHRMDGWFGGICIGRQISKGWDIDGEVHIEADNGASHVEAIMNLATRIDISENYTLMFLVGRDLSNTLGPTSSFMSYVGLQIRI